MGSGEQRSGDGVVRDGERRLLVVGAHRDLVLALVEPLDQRQLAVGAVGGVAPRRIVHRLAVDRHHGLGFALDPAHGDQHVAAGDVLGTRRHRLDREPALGVARRVATARVAGAVVTVVRPARA
jgi:hypothetical protein